MKQLSDKLFSLNYKEAESLLKHYQHKLELDMDDTISYNILKNYDIVSNYEDENGRELYAVFSKLIYMNGYKYNFNVYINDNDISIYDETLSELINNKEYNKDNFIIYLYKKEPYQYSNKGVNDDI